MSHHLHLRLSATPAMLDAFADEAVLEHALRFEVELARASAAEGVIAQEAADAIASAAATAGPFDTEALAIEAAHAGTLAIPLVKRLRSRLPPGAAEALHRGATSQDVADTVLMLQAKIAAGLVAADLRRVVAALTPLAGRYATFPAVGRTLLQDAAPIGFGLRIAHWAASIADAMQRLETETAASARLQLGGATGTRAGLGGKGVVIATRIATSLGVADACPWHTDRGGIAAIGSAIALAIAALGKMARDISLLAQTAIGELHEPAIEGRGGSSAMPHKRNPTGCQVALSAAHRAPGIMSGIHFGLIAEEERGLGGWQAEGPALVELFLLASGAAAAMAVVAEGLEVHEDAIQKNLATAGVGQDIGESAALVAMLIARTGPA